MSTFEQMETTTIEGNKLIDKFYRATGQHVTSVTMPEKMEYHSSWDWLLPVFEKISELKDPVIFIEIRHKVCSIKNISGSFYHEFEEDTTIKAVWLAIIEFIKFWNNEKK